MSIVEERRRQLREQKQKIDTKIESEQITPTKDERQNIGEIIKLIANRYRAELNSVAKNGDRAASELNKKITNDIRDEVDKMDISYESKMRLLKLAVSNIIGLGPLQQYLDNPQITEIIVQRFDNICVEKEGKVYTTQASFPDEDSLVNVINRILQPVGRVVNSMTPIVDAYLKEDGSRVCATIPPVSPYGATLTIRKFSNEKMTAEKYIELKSMSPKILEFLKMCVFGKVSIFVSGGTSTGKTTFLNMLSTFLPENELIVTIEDTLELQLHQKNVRSMQTRQINNEGMLPVNMAELVKTSLRMRPDRIIVGETRDGSVVSLLSAMSTGHEGSMSTGHANSPYNLVNVRIPMMMEMDNASSFTERSRALMISEAIQLVVQLQRLPNGRRIVSHVSEISGIDNKDENKVYVSDIFRYNIEQDDFIYTGRFPKVIAGILKQHGITLEKTFFTD